MSILANPLPRCSTFAAWMLAEEDARGMTAIKPTDDLPEWFDPFDWSPWPVISYGHGEVHIIAVASAKKGALRRLIDRAAEHGLSPVVVCPLGLIMPAILTKWGWKETVIGEGWDRREEWRPA